MFHEPVIPSFPCMGPPREGRLAILLRMYPATCNIDPYCHWFLGSKWPGSLKHDRITEQRGTSGRCEPQPGPPAGSVLPYCGGRPGRYSCFPALRSFSETPRVFVVCSQLGASLSVRVSFANIMIKHKQKKYVGRKKRYRNNLYLYSFSSSFAN